MLGKRSDQRGLWEADHLHLDLVGRDSFYERLAGLRGQQFREEDFAALYCRDNGRSSVPPSLLATALLLLAHDKERDAEAHRRATVDLSWKVALGMEVRPFVQSTLQHFRAQLVLHGQMRELFLRSLIPRPPAARTESLASALRTHVTLISPGHPVVTTPPIPGVTGPQQGTSRLDFQDTAAPYSGRIQQQSCLC